MRKKNSIIIIAVVLVLSLLAHASVSMLMLCVAHECVGSCCIICESLSFCKSFAELHIAPVFALVGISLCFAIALKVLRETKLSLRICSLYTLGVSLLD